jgi:CubicO group peptidase (beta-lactamase class C family)
MNLSNRSCKLFLKRIFKQRWARMGGSLVGLVSIVVAVVTIAQLRSESREARVDRLFAPWDKPDSPGCALAVIQGGQIVYERGYGMANLEHDIPISPQTTFYVGSLSKQFTAMSVLLLVEQGKPSLDDDVHKYVPEIPDYGHPITIRHLIHHTSGLPDFFVLWHASGRDFADFMPEEHVLGLLARQRTLNFTPGHRFEYSNSGYFLLSLIVKRVSGQSLREFAEENMFRPLGMRDTHFHDDRTMVVKNRAAGHLSTADGGFGLFTMSFDLVGSGGLYTTVEDFFLWDQNFYQNRLGQGGRGLIDQMYTRGTLDDGEELDYAFGLVVEEYRGSKMISHGGGFIGFRAELVRFPEQHGSVAVLCNLDSIDASQLARNVADIYFFSEGVD